MSRSVVLYTRAGCHLCEDAEALLRTELRRRPFALQIRDVDSDPELARRYGVRVPVVAIDGEEAFELQVDARRLAAAPHAVPAPPAACRGAPRRH